MINEEKEIYVPALMDGDRVVVPEVWLDKDVEYREDKKDKPLSAAEYNSQMQLPTLAELRHAYFDKADGNFVSHEYSQSVLSKKGYGEWTSTFLEDGRHVIERPENVVYRNGVWVVEGGKVTRAKLPPDGWTLEYDKHTGFPSRTSTNRKDAEKVFGNDTSYFLATRSGVRAVLRGFTLGHGPFCVDVDYGPDDGHSHVGGRTCRRSQ